MPIATPNAPQDAGNRHHRTLFGKAPDDKFEKQDNSKSEKSESEKPEKEKGGQKPNLGWTANLCAVLGGAGGWMAAVKLLKPVLPPFRYLGLVAAAGTYLGTLGAFSAAKQKREEGHVDKRLVVSDVASNMMKSIVCAIFPVQ